MVQSELDLLIQCVHNAIWIARNPSVKMIDPHIRAAADERTLAELLDRLLAQWPVTT